MSKSVAKAALIIMVMNLASRVLGFVRETVIANQFGATHLTDAYLVAYTIPYFIQAVLGMALVTSIVPVVTKYLVADRETEAWKISSITLNWTSLIMGALAILGVLGARVLVKITAPGFDEATTELAVTLTRIMFPSLVFVGIAMLITGMLNAKKRFAVAAFAPGFTSLIIIISVLVLGKYSIEYLAWGTLLGMVGAMVIQLPILKRANFTYQWNWSFSHPEVKLIFINILPIFLGTAVNQLYLAINRYFASSLAEGSISALNYASKLMNLPMGIFVLAVSSAIYPTLSEHAIKQERAAMGKTLVKGVKSVLLITLPAAAGLMALKTPIVKLLFERGAFDELATMMTADALFYFCIGMFAMSANMVITRAYYALGDVKTPLYLGLISIAVNVVASIGLMPSMGHSGLALANSIAVIFNALFLYAFLKGKLPQLYLKELAGSTMKSLLASVATGFAAYIAYSYASLILGAISTKMLLAAVGLGICCGMLVYGIAIILLKEEEGLAILGKIKARVVNI